MIWALVSEMQRTPPYKHHRSKLVGKPKEYLMKVQRGEREPLGSSFCWEEEECWLEWQPTLKMSFIILNWHPFWHGSYFSYFSPGSFWQTAVTGTSTWFFFFPPRKQNHSFVAWLTLRANCLSRYRLKCKISLFIALSFCSVERLFWDFLPCHCAMKQ